MANFWDNDTPDTATLPEPPPQDFWKNDIPEAPAAPVEDYWQNDTPEDKPFFNFADTASALVDFGRGIVNTTPAALSTLSEGLTRPDKWSENTLKNLERDEAFQREMAAKTEKNRAAGTSSSVGESIREAGSSAGFSFGSMAAALPATVAGAYLTRSKLGVNLAGGFAGGTAAYRMAGARFLNDSFKDWQTQEEKRLGRPVTETEKEAAYQELLPLAQNAGLWEAGPEAIGNMATLGAGKVILGLGKNRITDLAKGSLAKLGIKAGAAAGAIGTELATETVTQVGQGLPQAQAEAIAAGQDPALAQSAYPVSVEGVTQAFKDVAPQTLALSGLMMGAAGGVNLATKPFRNQPAAVPPPLPTNTPPTPGTPHSAITPLVNIARQAGAQDRVRLTPEEAAAGLADPGTIEGDLLTDARFRPPFQAQPPGPLDPGRFGNVTEGLDTLPTNDLSMPDVTAAMPQMGGAVSYEGYQGRLDRDNEGRLVVDTGDQIIEVADTRGLTRLPNQPTAPQAQPTATEQAPAMQTPSGINPAPAGTGFVAAPGDQVALVDELGKVYVPQNRRLDRTVRVAPDGAVEVLVQRVDQPGRILRLRGAQAQQAQTALLDAVIAQESQARGIRPPTPGTVRRQGSALPFEEIVGMAAAAIRNGVTSFSAWATAMVRRFGQAVSQYLADAWKSAVKNSEVGAVVNPQGDLEGVSRHVLLAKRGEREVAKSARISPEEKAALANSAGAAVKALKEKLAGRMSKEDRLKVEARVKQLSTVKGLKEIETEARDVKLAHPQAQGWAPMELSGVNKDGGLSWKGVNYGFSRDNAGKPYQPGTESYNKRVRALAAGMRDNVRAILQRAIGGDVAAEKIISQASWYKAMRSRLRREFGGLGDLFADLLGATSPNTPVRDNWANAVDVMRRAMRGDFDALMPEWVRRVEEIERLEVALRAMMNEGLAAKLPKNKIQATQEWKETMANLKEARKIPDSLLPMKESGKKYGFNGRNVIRALVDLWRVVKNPEADIDFKGTAPKAINFSGNLIGFRSRATIDVWAARMLQRLAGKRRLPAVTEGSVEGEMLTDGRTTKAFGFGQDVFAEAVRMIRQDTDMAQNEVLANINDDDLQALVWFIEKEIWSVNNWTSAAGEGGSFEFEADLTGTADQAQVKELRRIADSTKSTSQQRLDALAELNKVKREVTRFVGGLSIQQSLENQGADFVPADADMVQLRQRLESTVYETNPAATVVGMKALSSEGRYGAPERAIDLEVVGRENLNVNDLWQQMQTVAAEARQDAAFLARVLAENEPFDLAKHRPGVEIYFRTGQRGQAFEDTATAINTLLEKHDLFGFTVVVSPQRSAAALGGSMPDAVGLRLISMPEFSARYGDASWDGLDDGQLRTRMIAEQQRMDRLVDDLTSELPDVTLAEVFHYEVDVRFSHEYSTTSPGNESGGSATPSGGVGAGAWQGRTLRAAIEAAGVRPAAPGIDAESGGSPTEPGEVSRGDTGLEQAEPTGPPGGFTNTTVVARRPDGSTVIFAELVGMATQAVQAGVNLARWTADMVRQFGAGVRRYLQGAWQAANKTSRQGFLHPGDLPSVITTRLGLQQNAPFRVRQLGARDLFLGSALPTNMVPLVARSENEVKAVEQTAAQLARDLQAAETAAVNRRGLPLDRLHGHVTDFLNGVPVAGAILSAMDPVTYDRARRMRNFIDDLTATVAASLPAGTMRDTLVNNTGSWLRRSYAAFDPNSGWNFENVMTAARKGKDVGGRPALDILRKGAAYLSAQNGYPASMRTAQGLPVAGSELESDMRNLMDRDQYERALSGQPGASKNVTSLMRRKDIPPEIRELMGEETNVYKRFTASASFQAQFIRRHHAQVAMRQVGLASGLFSMNRGGVFTQQIPADGPRWSGLEGVWTTPELWEALQLSTGVAAAGTDIAGYVGRFLRYTSSKAKLNRVAMNPDSWMVNGLGGAAMMLINGDWFSGRVAARLMESVRLMKSGRAKSGDVVNAAQDTLKDIQRDLIARLTAEGVFGAGVSVADIEASLPRHTLQWIETDLMRDRAAGAVEGAIIGQGMGRGFGPDVRVYGGIIGGALGGIAGAKRIRTAQNAIADLALTKPDMLFRLTGFLTNYEAALGAGLAPDAAFNEASTRTLNTFPNYAAVPAFLRSLSQFGAINSFVSFMFEMHRNTAWSMRYMAQDLAAPSMAQKRRGLQRLAGAGAVGALMAGGLPALISLLFGGGDDKDKVGMDDERNNIFTRWFAAPWERDAILAFTKFDKEGVSYLNTSYLLPQQILGELAMAARNGDNPTDAAARIAVRLQTQFAGDSVNLTPLMQAYTNTDGRGRPVTVRSGIEGAWERTDHALKVIAEPGFVEKVNKLIYAYRDAERRGRTFSVEQEFRRVIGLRETTRTWSDLTLGRYKEFDSQIGRIREGANRTLGENLPGAKATALERANRELAEIRTELQRFEKEAVKLGVPFGILQRAKKDVGLSNIRNVMVDPIKGNRVKSIGTR
jgi:hypothetical protein